MKLLIFIFIPFIIFSQTIPDFVIGMYGIPQDEITASNLKKLHINALIDIYADNVSMKIKRLGYNRIMSAFYFAEENSKKRVEKYSKQKNVLAWYMMDEPDINRRSVKQTKYWYNTIKYIDKKHPVLLTLYKPDKYKEYGRYCDIFAPITYVVERKNSKKDKLFDVTRLLNYGFKLFGNKKVIIPVIQCFGGGRWQRAPEPIELRNAVMQTLCFPVAGILYYSYNTAEKLKYKDGTEKSWYLPDHKNLITELIQINKWIKKYSNYFSNKKYYQPAEMKYSIDIPHRWLKISETQTGLIISNPYWFSRRLQLESKIDYKIDIEYPNKLDAKNIINRKSKQIKLVVPPRESIFLLFKKMEN